MSVMKRVRDESGTAYDIAEYILNQHKVPPRVAPKLTVGEHMIRERISADRVDPVYKEYLEAIETIRRNSRDVTFIEELEPGTVKLLQDDGFLVTSKFYTKSTPTGSCSRPVETFKIVASASLIARMEGTLSHEK